MGRVGVGNMQPARRRELVARRRSAGADAADAPAGAGGAGRRPAAFCFGAV